MGIATIMALKKSSLYQFPQNRPNEGILLIL